MRPHERITPSFAIFNLARIICNKYCYASYDIILVSFKGNKKTRQTLERSSFPTVKEYPTRRSESFKRKRKNYRKVGGRRKKEKRENSCKRLSLIQQKGTNKKRWYEW